MMEWWNDGMVERGKVVHSIIPSLLASPTKHRLPQVDRVRHDQLPPAVHALLAAATVHAKLELKPAALAGAGAVIPQCRPRRGQRTLQHIDDRRVEPRELLERQLVG